FSFCVWFFLLFFFFSSRRRHTRFSRDWSSDVCSSDLEEHMVFVEPIQICFEPLHSDALRFVVIAVALQTFDHHILQRRPTIWIRSEERRVGKESRCRWSRWRAREKYQRRWLVDR